MSWTRCCLSRRASLRSAQRSWRRRVALSRAKGRSKGGISSFFFQISAEVLLYKASRKEPGLWALTDGRSGRAFGQPSLPDPPSSVSGRGKRLRA